MAEKKIPTFDFYTIKKDDIENFLDVYASPDELNEYFSNAYVNKPASIMVPDVVTTADGQTVQKMTKLKKTDKETGKSVVVLDKDGKPVMVPKKKAVPVKDGKVKEKYSHREAVKWFIKTYVDITPPKAIITNRPEKKAEKGESELTKRLRAKAKAE